MDKKNENNTTRDDQKSGSSHYNLSEKNTQPGQKNVNSTPNKLNILVKEDASSSEKKINSKRNYKICSYEKILAKQFEKLNPFHDEESEGGTDSSCSSLPKKRSITQQLINQQLGKKMRINPPLDVPADIVDLPE